MPSNESSAAETSTGQDPDRAGSSLGFLVASAGQQAMAAFRLRLDPHGVHPREFAVLSALRADAHHSQQELSRLLGLPASRMVGILDSLERRDLVERIPHPTDGRAHVVRLTLVGRTKADELSAEAAELDRQLVRGLSPQQRTQLETALAQVLANLGSDSSRARSRIW